MTHPDLFDDPNQIELFSADDAPPREYHADQDKVRQRLQSMLNEVRTIERYAAGNSRLILYRTIFPQMSLWLPEEEAAQLRFEFEAELVRLKAA
jgi:hypothetical protein